MQVPFHAYAEGNLNWLAAEEAGSATASMALRIWPEEALSWPAAQQRLRASFTDALHAYAARHSCPVTQPGAALLDVGCGVGLSTLALAAAFPQAASVAGLDLSPYMLAVAALRGAPAEGPSVSFSHRLGEATALPPASADAVCASFLFHELPQAASRDICAEAFRLCRPGGVLAITDNDPASPTIQRLPPVLFTLMKSTEPHSDEYYTHDLEACLARAGFVDVVTVSTDPRHRAVFGRKP